MAEKRYFWIKLTDNLMFNDLKIKKLRKIAGGDTYTIIYLKLLLLSKNNKGIIEYEGVEKSIEEELAIKLDEDIENVTVTINYLKSVELLEEKEDSLDIFLTQAPTLVGSESASAERKRKQREKEKLQALDTPLLNEKCDNVTPMSQVSHTPVTSCHTDIDIDKDIDIDIDINKTKLNIINLYKKDLEKIIPEVLKNEELLEVYQNLSFDFKLAGQVDLIMKHASYLIMVYSVYEIYNSSDKHLLQTLDYRSLKDTFLKCLTAMKVSQNDFDENYDYKEFISYYIKSIKNYVKEGRI